MARIKFTPAAAQPIAPAFDLWKIDHEPDLFDRLAFNPKKLGSQFYPTVDRTEQQRLMLTACGQIQRGFKALSVDERKNVTNLVVTISTKDPVGFDAYLPALNKTDSSDMTPDLPLGPGHGSGLCPRVVRIAMLEERDDMDPLVLMAAARHVRFYLKVDREAEVPRLVVYDAEVTSRPEPFFSTNLHKTEQQPTVLMLTAAQRALIGAMEVGPKVKFREVTLPTGRKLDRHPPKVLAALKLVPGGGGKA